MISAGIFTVVSVADVKPYGWSLCAKSEHIQSRVAAGNDSPTVIARKCFCNFIGMRLNVFSQKIIEFWIFIDTAHNAADFAIFFKT